MSKIKRLLSVLVAAFMLFTMPITTGIARTVAEEGTTDQAEPETPSESIALEMEEMDPAKLHVHKLGEVDEEEEGDGFDPAELEIIDLNKIVRASIFLDGKSTIDMGYDTQDIANNSSATAYRNKLKQQQKTMQAKIEAQVGHELTVKWNLTLLANAISVEIPYKDVAMIRRMAGVKSVELETQYEAPEPVSAEPNTANTSANMVGAQYAWTELGYTGAGSRVAIIDTGIDATHQSFADAGFNHAIELVRAEGKTVELMSSIPSSGLNASGAIKLNNGDKIPYAYNYVDHNTTMTHNDAGSNHGSHVAGIAAANRFIKNGSNWEEAVDYVGAVGMAPDAQLLVMKVFGAGGGAYDSDYFAAIEDAVVLGADACNLSLGSGAPGFTYASSTYQETLNGLVNNTTNNHMVLSISAGNAYSADRFTSHALYAEDVSFHTGGSPGSYVHSMGVAAAQNTLTEGTPLMFNGSQQVFYTEDLESSEGTAYKNPAMTTIAGTYSYVYIDAVGEAADYQTVNSAVSLSGKIVIVNRGSLSFVQKGNNAVSYSPKALICANNSEGTIHMSLDDFNGTFPYVGITLKDAEAIKAASTSATAGGITYYTGSVQVTTTQVSTVTPRDEAEVTDFSSWGVPGSLLMKPDITAPGGDIYSVYGIDGSSTTASNQYGLMSGTSMAAPHITGLSAVLMQYLKEKTPDNADLMSGYNLRAIANSLLMSTATPMINSNAYVSILQQGAGLVEVSKAIEAKSVIMMDDAYLTTDTNANADGKVKVELGDDPEKAGEYTYKFTIYNLSDETLEYELGTDLFTQKVSGDTLSHKTILLPAGGDTYEWDGEAPAEEHDVNKDGVTDDLDAQAILDLVSGELEMDDPDYDFDVADLDGDDIVTSHDAYLLLNFEGGAGPQGYVVGPHDKAQVTVHITLTDAQKAALDKEGGAWLEGFTYVDCVTVTDENEDLSHEHTIPILGYYGSFTDPSMFDTNSYTESLYGNEQENYSGKAAENTNYMRITTFGTLQKFAGNPYMVENEFPEEHLAIRSDAVINDIAYNLIRNAGGTGFAITKLDEDGNVTDIVTSTVNGQEVEGLWYYVNQGSWQNTMTKVYNVNKALMTEYNGIEEGDRFRVGFYAIPEYNAMKHSSDMTAASAGTLTGTKFAEMLETNELGKGAYVGFDFTVDDTAPVIVGQPNLNTTTNELSITASDNLAIAYIGILSLDGSVKYAEVAPGTNEYTVSLDATDAIANAYGYVAAFVGDYAGNEAAYAVKVNNNTHVEKTVYVLSDTLTADNDYLVVNTNATGTGYGLSYTAPASSNAIEATATTFAATIKAGTTETNGKNYIESSDAPSTGVWTAASGITLSNVNGSKTWRIGRSNNNNLTIGTSPRYTSWSYSSNRLRSGTSTRYLYYSGSAFTVGTATTTVYLYQKTTISYDVDPYNVSSVEVIPNSVVLYKGTTANLTAKVSPLTVSDRTVTWSTSNANVATVDQNGKVTAVASGTATITATSNADSSKYGACTVTVVAANKTLYGIVWDEQGEVYFSNFNSDTPSSWNKNHTTAKDLPFMTAFMQSASNLYAGTLDTSDLSTNLYTINRTSYAQTSVGENYVGMMDAAVGLTSAANAGMVYCYGPYVIGGNYSSSTVSFQDGSSFTGTGIPYGLLDFSETSDAYVCAVAAKAVGGTSSTYYLLDENGDIWITTLSRSGNFFSGYSYDFSTPSKQASTGISCSFLYQTLYYDGTYLYWGHQDGDIAEMIVIRESDWKVFRIGDFGENVWPAVGFYTNGALAPNSIGDEAEIMGEGDELENAQPQATRSELLTEEVQARFAEELEKFGKSYTAPDWAAAEPEAIDEEPIELPEMENEPEEPVEEPIEEPAEEPIEEPVEEPIEEPVEEPIEEPVEEPAEEPVEEPAEPEEGADAIVGAPRAITGTPNSGTIPFAESEASTNGYFTVAFDPDVLEYVSSAKGTEEGLFVSIHVDDKGVFSVSYAMKGETALAADTTIATATFTADTCADAELEVITLERGEDVELDEDETITITGTGHDWAAPTYEWAQEGDDWTCTATRVCNNNNEHVETEKVTATAVTTDPTCTEAGSTVYTATFENEAFAQQTRSDTIPATGHDWGDPEWTWTGSETTAWTAATATFTCANDDTHVETVNATITTAEDNGYLVFTATATFNEQTYTDTKSIEIGYYLIGTISSWEPDATYRFAPNTGTEGEYILNVTNLAVNEEIKVVRAAGTTKLTWYPDNAGNYVVDYPHSGNVNVYFRPAGNSDWNSFHTGGFFYISKLHTVTVITDGNGTASVDPSAPDVTATVTLTATPSEGYHFDHADFYEKTGDNPDDLVAVDLALGEGNTFTMPDYDVVIKVYFAAHTWSEPTYVWAEDNSTVTATRECTTEGCDETETETVNTTSEVTTPATCTTAGKTTYTATFANEAFATQTKEVENIDPLGHDWDEPTYVWDENNNCTATRVCKNDSTHTESETAPGIGEVTTPATCTTAGKTTYTATFANPAFTTQTKEVENIDPIGHDWDEPTYVWAEDNSTVTATRVCKNDSTHVETETVNTTSEVTTPATCETAGKTTYTATFTNEAFTTQTKEVENIDPLGHKWGEPTYEWSEDNLNCTAKRVCENDPTHIEEELAAVTSEVTTPATCTTAGKTTYTATFTNEAFTTQTKEVENIDPIGHDWDEPTYVWAEDNSTVTATRVCKNDSTHTETETVNTTSEVTTPATCTTAGKTTYTATFANEAFATQTKEVENVPALGHDWTFVNFTWTEIPGGWSAVANYKCNNNEDHTQTVEATVTSVVGNYDTVYTATVTAEASLDGEEHTDTKQIPLGPAFMSQSLLLEGDIGVRFYVRLPQDLRNEDTNVSFTISGKNGNDYATIVPYSTDLKTNSKDYVGFTFYVNTIQMADTITATLNCSDGETLEKTYSVKEYFESFNVSYAAHPEAYTDEIAALIKATADLGHYMQPYLESRGSWSVANGDHAAMDVFYTQNENGEETILNYLDEATGAVAGHAISATGSNSDIKKLNYTVNFESQMSIHLIVQMKPGFNGTVTATADGAECTVTQQSGTRKYLIEINNVQAHQLSHPFVITITTDTEGAGTLTLTGSGLTYAQMILAGANGNTVTQKAMTAFYRYSQAADAVKGNPADIDKVSGSNN